MSNPLTSLVLRSFFLALMALSLAAGCSGCGEEKSERSGASATVKAPVPAPEGLIAKLVIPRPQVTLDELRKAAGGPALFLPRTVGALIANALGLPIQIAELVDAQLPFLGASLEVEGELRSALAVHVKDASRLVTFVANGKDAGYESERDGDLIWLKPKKAPREGSISAKLALVDNYLVAGQDEAAVRALGPYLARTLSAEEPPKVTGRIELTKGAIEPLREALRRMIDDASWPSELAAFVSPTDAAATALAMLEGVGAGAVEIDLGPTRLELRASFTKERGAEATIAPKTLLDLPDDVVAALAFSDGERDVEGRAKRLQAWLGDDPRIAPALQAIDRGMGEDVTMALRCTGVGLTGLARGPVVDAGALRDGLGELITLLGDEKVAAQLAERELELTSKERRLEQVPFDVHRLRLLPKGDAGEKKPPMSEIDFLFGVGEDRFQAAAGMETVETMQRLARPDPERILERRAAVGEALGRLPEKVWLVASLDAQGLHACQLGKPGGQFVTPVVLGIGPRNGKLVVRFEMSRLLLRAAAEAFGL